MDSKAHNKILITRILQVFLILFFLVTLLRTAWVNDDAYITLRTVDNFVHGYGLTWNPGERVQVFTHPLWMFLLSGFYALTHEAYFTTLGVSILLSLGTVILFSKQITKDLFSGSIGMVILCLSPAFVEYATSGLENPLTYLLLSLFMIHYFRLPDPPSNRQVFLLGFLASLAMLNRLDTGLFYLPALLWILVRQRCWRNFWVLIASASPLLLWETFSLVYYGFPFPNTAYAKLETGVSQADLILQGWRYFQNLFSWDPLTFFAILASVILAFIKGKPFEKTMAFGFLLFFVYILYIGGDFMSGRLFAAPLLICTTLNVSFFSKIPKWGKAAILVAVVFLGFIAHSPTQFNPPTNAETAIGPHGIADERGFYFKDSGLVNIDPHAPVIPNHPWARDGLALKARGGVSVEYSIGYLGYFAGPGVHIVDLFALADPLLARLPIPDPKDWRIGHFIRAVPEGYVESLETETNLLKDPALAAYYDKLKLITSGKIFDPIRLKTILVINLGGYNSLIHEYVNRQPRPSNP